MRVIGSLLVGFARRVSFERDFEQQLSFYVETRAAFTNVDAVLVFLVQVLFDVIFQSMTSHVCVCFCAVREQTGDGHS